jgi:hypothetical protein
MRKGMLVSAVTMTALAVPSAARAQFGDPVRVALDGVVELREVIGDAGHPTAFLNATSVMHQDAKGRWHRFRFDGLTTGARLVPLEDGGGMLVWQNASSILVRRWHRDGTTEAPQTVLSGVADPGYASHEGSDYPQWDLSFDRRGAVVIVGVAPPGPSAGAIYAVSRGPDGSFGAPQVVRAPDPAPSFSYTTDSLPLIRVSPLAPDGSVSVRWDWPDGLRRATRTGLEGGFDAPVPDSPSAVDASTVYTVDSRAIRLAADVVAACAHDHGSCGGEGARLYAWAGAPSQLLLRVQADDSFSRFLIARRGPDGRYRDPRPAPAGMPIWSTKRGVIDWWQIVPGDYAGHGGGLYRVPFGMAPRRTPRVLVDGTGEAGDGRVSVQVRCDQPCRLQTTVRSLSGSRSVRRTSAVAKAAFTGVSLTSRVPAGATQLQVTVAARAHGRSAQTIAVLRRSAPGQWLVTSTSTQR